MRKLLKLLAVGFSMFFTCSLLAQTKTVSGTVLDEEDKTPLPKVSVRLKGQKTGVATNDAGYFSIPAKLGDILVFSYVGFVTKEVIIGSEDKLNISLVSRDNEVGEVVVTAYGRRQNKRDLTYQAINVDGNEIAGTRRENFINALAGRIPGATITSTTGMPGSSSSIILRGPTSLDGTNQPIFVVDGVIIDNSAMEMQDRLPGASSGGVNQANRTNDFANRAMDLNMDDIENITILKGPEATALYGSDGANGAIIITTKKGKKGRASVTYNNSFRFENITRFPKIQTVFDNGNQGVSSGIERRFFGQKFPSNSTINDNIGNFFRTGKTQQHNLSIDGGSDVGTYRFTVAYINQEGVVPNTGFERYSARLSTTFKLSSKFNVSNSFNFISSLTNKASKGNNGFLLSLLSWPVDDDVRNYLNPNGTRRTIRGGLDEDDNPFFDVNKNRSFDKNDRVLGNFTINYDPAKWLSFTSIIGVDFYATNGTWYQHPESQFGRIAGGVLQQFRENQKLLNGVFKAAVRKKIGNVSNTLVSAFTFDTRKYEVNAVRGEKMFDPDLLSINNADPLTYASITTIENYNRLGAFINYTATYKTWLNVSLAGRMDGSSRLVDPFVWNSADPYYFYWSAGTSFIFSDLFNTLPKWLSYGKARLNYATTGRDPRAPYVKSNQFRTATTTGGGVNPFVIQGNPELRPEFSNQFETGLELKFLKNRLGIDVAYYDNRTKDQLLNPRLSYASGAILKWINGGTVQNKGVEILLTANPVKSKKFNWDVTVNFARNRNEVLEMPEGFPFFYNSDSWVAGIRGFTTKGSSIFLLSANRYQRNTNGALLISGTTGLPLVTTMGTSAATSIISGDRQPDFTMGFVNTFNFNKTWTLSFNLDIRRGGDIWNGTEWFLYTRGLSTRTLDREQPRIVRGVISDGLQNTANPTQNNIVITPLFRSEFYSTAVEEDFIEKDVHWLRMRDVTISFQVPSSWLKRQKVFKSASINVTGTDLFILSNYTGQDPAANANNVSTRGGIGGIGMDFGSLATPKGILFGIRCQF